jgi:hypothetical protein
MFVIIKFVVTPLLLQFDLEEKFGLPQTNLNLVSTGVLRSFSFLVEVPATVFILFPSLSLKDVVFDWPRSR